jgi:D-methionine transport system ATP-binding protein
VACGSPRMIHLERLNHRFQQGPLVLDDVTLRVARGERLALVGRSGSGKSTLLRCMNLLVRPSAGRVFVDDTDLLALDEGDLAVARRDIGMVFQHFALLKRQTVFENIAFPLRVAGVSQTQTIARVEQLLALVGLGDAARRYPAQLSGGQRQRVGLARALAHRPRLLLCDEPTSALDAATASEAVALLRSVSGELNLTLVVVTHDLDVARALADRVAVLDGGLLAEETNAATFFSMPTSVAGRRLTGHGAPLALPFSLANEAQSQAGIGPSTLLAVSLAPTTPRHALFETLATRFKLSVEIVGAHLAPVGPRAVGQLAVVTHGDPAVIRQALEALSAQQVTVEVLGHVRPAA